MRGDLARAAAWTAVAAFWTVAARDHHPTWAVDAAATALLVGVCAAASEVHRRVLVPRFLARGRTAAYLGALGLTLVGLTLAVVPAIQGAYAVLWHPDPRRFGWLTNLSLDFVFIAVHLAGAVALRRLLDWRRPAPAVAADAPGG